MVTRSLRQSRHVWIALAAYLLLAAFYSWPLLGQARTHIVSDPFDPILNASILWWNATVVPFSTAWWTPPFFFPSHDIAAFTENLTGLGPLSTPVFWLTRNPTLTYNLTLFLTWPLSAVAAYLLSWKLLRRHDAAFIAGLAFGFAPYRLAQLGHIQVLSIFWLPLALLGLHGYVAERRRRWLLLFAAAWILQSLSNGYFMFFGGVIIALWIAYFCSARPQWRALMPVMATWVMASLPLIAIMLKYRAVHDYNHLSLLADAASAFGAQWQAWLGVPRHNWFWSRLFGEAGPELDLFPGATAVALVVLAILVFLLKPRQASGSTPARRSMRLASATIGLVSLLAVTVTYAIGPWKRTILGMSVQMTDIERAAPIAIAAGLLFVWLTPAIVSRLRARSVFAFYAATTAIVVILACGPDIHHHSRVLLTSAPYGWLMMVVPGLEGLRVAARFWMVGAMCLSIAAAAAFAWLTPRPGLLRTAVLCLVCGGLMLDGWPRSIPMAPVPESWPSVEPAGEAAALIELPLGPPWDAAATFRSMGHRRRVVNGVSGYDPQHYRWLKEGIDARDPNVLLALATFGPLEVVINGTQDGERSWKRYVERIAGVSLISRDGTKTRYRLPNTPPPAFGPPLSIRGVTASAAPDQAALAVDGNNKTAWFDQPQHPEQWFRIDLGSTQTVGMVELSIGANFDAFPRRLAIDLSQDGTSWHTVWDGSPLGAVVRGAALNPTDVRLALPIDPAEARFIRLRQLSFSTGWWAIVEVRVLAPGR